VASAQLADHDRGVIVATRLERREEQGRARRGRLVFLFRVVFHRNHSTRSWLHCQCCLAIPALRFRPFEHMIGKVARMGVHTAARSAMRHRN
jgi:hypothetical protein